MKLNKIEFWTMNNRLRAFIQDKIEIKRLRKLSTLPKNKVILEIGCGNGVGTKLIKKHFAPKKIHAIDLDAKMITLAKQKNQNSSNTFQVADATLLPFKDNSFDAIVDFGVIHHIPNWKDALKEMKRVLKPNGELIIEDLSIDTFSTIIGRFLKLILKHPYDDMYTQKEFVDALKDIGFTIPQIKYYNLFIKYFALIAKNK